MSIPLCPVWEGEMTVCHDWEVGELIDCEECGSMLEVINNQEWEFDEAPEEDEDWGE